MNAVVIWSRVRVGEIYDLHGRRVIPAPAAPEIYWFHDDVKFGYFDEVGRELRPNAESVASSSLTGAIEIN